MSRTITVEGDVNAIDTRVLLTGQGSVTAPSLVVPAGMTKIKQIVAAAASDAAAAGGATFLVRLGGNAVLNGEQSFFIGGGGAQLVQSGSDRAPSIMPPFCMNDVDIDVRPSDTITIAAEMPGVDLGDTSFVVTLIYGR